MIYYTRKHTWVFLPCNVVSNRLKWIVQTDSSCYKMLMYSLNEDASTASLIRTAQPIISSVQPLIRLYNKIYNVQSGIMRCIQIHHAHKSHFLDLRNLTCRNSVPRYHEIVMFVLKGCQSPEQWGQWSLWPHSIVWTLFWNKHQNLTRLRLVIRTQPLTKYNDEMCSR